MAENNEYTLAWCANDGSVRQPSHWHNMTIDIAELVEGCDCRDDVIQTIEEAVQNEFERCVRPEWTVNNVEEICNLWELAR